MFIIIGEVLFRYIFNSKSLQTRININKYSIANIKNINSRFDFSNLRFEPYSKNKIYHSEYNFIANHDKYGFRNPCYNFTLEAQKILIGDSFVYGIGVNDKDTLGCQLIIMARIFIMLLFLAVVQFNIFLHLLKIKLI